jgi:hypothetical protein
MKGISKFFAITAAISFGCGIAAVIGFTILEHRARLHLTPEMRTPEAIQYYYDGAVCLGCDFGRIAISLLSFTAGLFLLFLWIIYEAVSIVRKSVQSI